MRQRELLDSHWRFHPGEVNGSGTGGETGTAVTQWIWIADNNAPNDSATMAAPGLDTSAWSSVSIGTDVFNGSTGYAWFRTELINLASQVRPLALHFVSVDDDAAVYLNGVLVGEHSGWSSAFDIPLNPALLVGGTNVVAVAVHNGGGGPGGIYGGVYLQSGLVTPPGILATNWLWLADDNAPQDADSMTATNLDTSSWQNAVIGQDVFGGHVGWAWFRTWLDAQGLTNLALKLHFVAIEDNANIYLNSVLIAKHTGGAQPFEVSVPDSLWTDNSSNLLAVAVQNTGGPGGITGPVSLEAGAATSSEPATGDAQDPSGFGFDDSAWRIVHLPHDYIVEGTFTNTADASHGSLPLSTAWYRNTFTLPASNAGKDIWIDFDGVYHNAKVWINGHYLGQWHSGYAAFRYDITPFAVCGGTNVLAVHVDPQGSEGWWYEGGGIYRHVWVNAASKLHIAPWGTFVASAIAAPYVKGTFSAVLTITTTVTNADADSKFCTLASEVVGPDGISVGTVNTSVMVPSGTATNVIQTLAVSNARLWSLETPQLYRLHSTVSEGGETVDNLDTPFGIRSIRFDVQNGFFLNGRHVKLNGTCNHQDFAGVGIGMPDNLLYWRIKKLKEMGANAYRCSHNPPTEALLDACDQLGMVVMDETRHLGDATGQKSDAGTTYSDLSELDSMILRDRNHPSIIMWSMCNEEFSVQGTQAGANMFYAMKNRVLQFDTTRPITCAMNGDWGTGITLVEDLQGCNYNPGGYDSFHASFPSLPMFASETTSAVTDRGVYTNDSTGGYVTSYNNTTDNAWQPVGTRDFVAGGFVWTGFDYKGEPSPYGWPCVNSHFGIMDMCGLPKDAYYYYKAWWGDKPLVHVFPHWNWSTPGQAVSVWCYANTETIELFLNGVSQGVQSVTPYRPVYWTVNYSPGTLLVKGYNGGTMVATDQVETTGSPASLRLTTDRTTLTADEEDLTVVYASVVDAQGRVVPYASNRVSFAVSGAGWVAGVGNGDPSSHEPDRGSQRHAFNGWCMVLVGATNTAGSLTLTATSPGLAGTTMNLQALSVTDPPAAPTSLSAVPGDGLVHLSWPISFGATSYRVKRANVSGGPYATLADYTALSFDDTSVTNGDTYFYVVSAVSSNGESPDSMEASATPTASATPAAPTGLVAFRDDAQVGLTWNAVPGASGYNIKRSTNSNGPFVLVGYSASASYTDTELTNDTTYFYVVSAQGADTKSPDSSQASATPTSMSYLVGTITGTTGSWNNTGNTREKAMDDDTGTFFDAPSGNGDWVGLDLGAGAARVISKIRFASRSGFASRMTGGLFQGANTPSFSDAVTFFTLTSQPPDNALTTLLNSNLSAFRYVRYLSPNGGFGNIAELEFYSPGPHITRATGTIIGSTGASGNTSDKVFDGDLTSFFDSTSPNGNWVALDLGGARVITYVRYCPRGGYGSRMVNGIIQGANASNFSDAVILATIGSAPPDATLTAQPVFNPNAFRYVRYLSPANSYGDIAELQFFSSTPEAAELPAAPTGLTATAGDKLVGLTWNASSGAAKYNIKRSSVSGGPYTTIASRVATVHMDSELTQGTYFYVVSAVNASGESTNSDEVSVVIACSTPTTPGGLAVSAENGQMILAWSPVAGSTSYNVLRGTDSLGPFDVIATGITGTTYADTTVTNKTIYYYTVQAVNACGASTEASSVSTSLASLNVTPVLAPVPNQTLIAGQILSLTNSAGDVDAPPQTLTYSLPAAPAGATINPVSGVLNWRPAIAQSGSTHSMAVAVSDDGVPVLSAVRNFTVNVLAPSQPVLNAAEVGNGIFQSQVSGDFGPDYSVFGSSNLTDWELISTTNQPSMPFRFVDRDPTNNSQRFYRVLLGP